VIDLIDPTSIFVSAPMDEVDSGAIRAGLPVKLSVDSRPDEQFVGHVLRVAPYVLDEEAQNRTLEIEVGLDDPKIAESLLPGTSADAEVILESRSDVIRVPTSALLPSRSGGQAVLVLEDGELVVAALDKLEIEPGVRAVAADSPAKRRSGSESAVGTGR
jgi:HlyD family secretion protein